jgi:hypothetical protein
MKKTLKLVGIFIGVLIIAIVGGLGGYYLIAQNKTYYIYDLRLVEPKGYESYYVYTDSDEEYTSIKNKKVYLTSNSENKFEIGVYAYTSTNTTDVEVSSSDTSVAKIVVNGRRCYVEYLKEGVATISVSIGSVTDSFDLYVYNEIAESFVVYDSTYYGDFAQFKQFKNKIVSYSDMTNYYYDYVAQSVSDEEGQNINNSLLRIDGTKVNYDVFDRVYIDSVNKKLVVRCKSDLNSNVDETLVIQSYYISNDDEIKVSHNYYVNVHIVAYTPEFLQIVLSTNPDFDDINVFMDTTVINKDDLYKLDEDELTEDSIENFLSYQKAEQYLSLKNESSVYETLFTEKVSKIYVKFRKVYTNGDIVYLTPKDIDENPYSLELPTGYLKLSANKEYYILTLTESYFESQQSFSIKLSLDDFDLEHTFEFNFAELTAENIAKFYDYDKELKIFTYTYWDPRTHYENEVYDENGNIIQFAGLNVDLSLFD